MLPRKSSLACTVGRSTIRDQGSSNRGSIKPKLLRCLLYRGGGDGDVATRRMRDCSHFNTVDLIHTLFQEVPLFMNWPFRLQQREVSDALNLV